jgi:hypothetical protein
MSFINIEIEPPIAKVWPFIEHITNWITKPRQ